jgi:hypothetical protein
MSVTALPVKRVIAPILLSTLSALFLFAVFPARPHAQTPAPTWRGGTALLGPLEDGSDQIFGVPMPFANPVSGDGRFVVFRTGISTLVPGDTNGVDDISVRDRATNQTTRRERVEYGR